MADLFDSKMLGDLLLQHVDAPPSSLSFTPVRTGKHNRSFWVDSDAGRFVLRIAPRDDTPDDPRFLFYERLMMRQEPALHALIASETELPVAEILAADFSRRRIDRDYLLMRALPGTPMSDAYDLGREERSRALYQVGRLLRELHTLNAREHLDTAPAVDGAVYGYLGAHHPMEGQTNWADAFHVMWNKLLDDVVACGTYTNDEARQYRKLLDTYITLFDRPVTPSLLHMDVWSQNILVDRHGNVTGLVDFDRALWGDIEIEFAVLDYCGISEPPFWEGYGKPRDTSPEATIRQRFYLLYEIQKYMPIRVWRSNRPKDALRYRRTCRSLAAQLN
ncbi:MAG: phosphotransferase family protein [Anaerolineae bacterium]